MEAWDWARHQSTPLEVRREGLWGLPVFVCVSGSVWKSLSVWFCASPRWQARGCWPFWLQGRGAALCLPGCVGTSVQGQANYTSVTLSSSLSWLETCTECTESLLFLPCMEAAHCLAHANRATDTEPPHCVCVNFHLSFRNSQPPPHYSFPCL